MTDLSPHAQINTRERDLERQITAYLELKGYVVLKTDSGQAARARAGRTTPRGAYGSLPVGEPDLLVTKGVHAFRLEIKSALGRLSDAQRMRHIYLQKCGCAVYVVRSLEGLDGALEEFWARVKREGQP